MCLCVFEREREIVVEEEYGKNLFLYFDRLIFNLCGGHPSSHKSVEKFAIYQ